MSETLKQAGLRSPARAAGALLALTAETRGEGSTNHCFFYILETTDYEGRFPELKSRLWAKVSLVEVELCWGRMGRLSSPFLHHLTSVLLSGSEEIREGLEHGRFTRLELKEESGRVRCFDIAQTDLASFEAVRKLDDAWKRRISFSDQDFRIVYDEVERERLAVVSPTTKARVDSTQLAAARDKVKRDFIVFLQAGALQDQTVTEENGYCYRLDHLGEKEAILVACGGAFYWQLLNWEPQGEEVKPETTAMETEVPAVKATEKPPSVFLKTGKSPRSNVFPDDNFVRRLTGRQNYSRKRKHTGGHRRGEGIGGRGRR